MFVKILGKVAALVAVALLLSRFVLPRLFKAFARLPELVLVGALAWCFGIALLAEVLGLSREMGALVAGVAISTYPYTLDVVAKVTSIRDFFITLFFVALGMTIPSVDLKSLGWALVIVVLVVATRFITVTIPLYRMGKGFRASLLPAIHLCALSELSVVIISEGHKMKNVSDSLFGMVSYAFVILSVLATFAISRSEKVTPIGFSLMRWLGMKDLGHDDEASADHNPEAGGHGGKRIYLLGFSWTASSLLEELQRRQPEIVKNLAVVDFNPDVHRELKARNVHAIYGDISQRDTLLHAGIGDAELILCTLPNIVLRGVTNLRLLKQLRELNSTAKIIVHAELCGDVAKLYEAGASHVLVTRLVEAAELTGMINAALTGGLGEKAEWLKHELERRREIIP
jgi:DNA-binding NarL/FixJ family response regulator